MVRKIAAWRCRIVHQPDGMLLCFKRCLELFQGLSCAIRDDLRGHGVIAIRWRKYRLDAPGSWRDIIIRGRGRIWIATWVRTRCRLVGLHGPGCNPWAGLCSTQDHGFSPNLAGRLLQARLISCRLQACGRWFTNGQPRSQPAQPQADQQQCRSFETQRRHAGCAATGVPAG